MTNTYNTGNPLGSTDPRDLYDNASNFDDGMNTVNPSFQDRLGVLRKTWKGMETEFSLAQTGRDSEFDAAQAAREAEFQAFLVASGFVSLGNYAAGINFTAYNQYMARAGFFYRPAPSSIPFTTTGTWAGADENLFVLLSPDDVLRQELADDANPALGASLVGYKGHTVSEKLQSDLPSVLDFGADPTGVIDSTTAIQAFIDAYNDLVQSGPASYSGGITAKLSKGVYLISSRLKLWSLITLEGDGPFTTVFKAAPGFTDFEYMMSASPSLDGTGTIRPAVGLRNLGFDHNNTGARGFIGHALNDNCIFDNIRSFNFRKSVVILDRGAGGGTVAQGWTLSNWHAITRYDIEEDVFITHEANEGLIIACKAMGLSSGVSTAVGFHIGKSAHSEGINIIGSSAAHLVNGVGVRFNDTRDCWATGNTFENVLRDVYIGHASSAASCSKNMARNNRHYPTVGAPGTQRDIYIDLATSCIGETRENGAIEITAAAVNCQGVLATNRTTGVTIPTTVTLASNSSVVLETHKNGSAIHHLNGSLSMDASASGQFDVALPGGGIVRGDANFVSLIAASGKGSRLISAGASATVNDNGITINSASTKTVALQENGVNKILLDGSGRVRVFGLTTAVPGVADALYKDASGFVKIT